MGILNRFRGGGTVTDKQTAFDSSAVANNGNVEEAPPLHSFGRDPEFQGRSLYEKKCILINRELDSYGMGRYQWCIWALCGFGYFIDLLWAQAFGLVLGPVQQEFGFGGTRDLTSIIVFFR